MTSRRLALALIGLLCFTLGFVAAGPTLIRAATSEATSFPCVGVPDSAPVKAYPERRVFLESQSWTEPQPARAGYAGSGQQGHIHVGTCWPLLQHLTGPSLTLDVQVLSHMRTQPIDYGLRVDAYDISAWNDHISYGPPRCYDGTDPSVSHHCFEPIDCRAETCEQWVHVDRPLTTIPASGLRSFYVFAISNWQDGSQDWGYGTWWAYVDNGNPAGTPVGEPDWISGESLFATPQDGGGKYARAFLNLADYPLDAASGKLKPVSGVWTFRLKEEGQDLSVLVDPHLHAHPTDFGTVVLKDAPNQGERTATVDTTKLSNGVHFLLVAAGKTGPPSKNGVKWWGVLKVPFLVQNDVAPPTSTTTTTTTMPPMYHPACEPTCDQQIETLGDRISRARAILNEP